MNRIQPPLRRTACAAALCALAGTHAHAVTFEFEGVRGSFDSTLTLGTGIRAKDRDCNLIVAGATGPNAPENIPNTRSPTASMWSRFGISMARASGRRSARSCGEPAISSFVPTAIRVA